MDERMNDLAVLDPARGREPTARQWATSRAAVERVIAGEANRRPARRATRRWITAGVAATAAGAVAAVAVPALLPGGGDEAIASWTAVPIARTGEQVTDQARECAAHDTGGVSTITRPSDVLLAEQRGDVTMLVLRKDNGVTVECLIFGDEGIASVVLADPGTVLVRPTGTVNLETMSVHGLSASGGGESTWSNVIGLAGPKVTAVEVRLDSGRTLRASVSGGWWGAWWPGPEGGEVDSLTVIVHTSGGTTELRPRQLG